MVYLSNSWEYFTVFTLTNKRVSDFIITIEYGNLLFRNCYRGTHMIKKGKSVYFFILKCKIYKLDKFNGFI